MRPGSQGGSVFRSIVKDASGRRDEHGLMLSWLRGLLRPYDNVKTAIVLSALVLVLFSSLLLDGGTLLQLLFELRVLARLGRVE
jgi:hypothetical protein